MRRSVLNRFWSKVKVTADDSCWEWQRGTDRHGYGAFGYKRKTLRAHRFIFSMIYGDPGERHVLHTCDNPLCVRLNHLFLGSHIDNMRDRDQKGRQWNLRKTHCPKGHPYGDGNTYRDYRGFRYCVTCRKLRESR